MMLKADNIGGRLRIIAIVGALACIAIVASRVYSGDKSAPRITEAAVLTSGSDFGLSGTVGNLTPGITSRLTLSVTNRSSRAITLTKVTVKVPAVPVGCRVANLTINGKDFAGSPPAVTITGLRARVRARTTAKVRLRMHLGRRASNRCQHARFPFRYTGFASTGRLERVPTR
jgi:hypothetical protein